MNTNSASCLLSKKCREQYSKEVNSKITDENEALENIYNTEKKEK
ncbi:MAG: hypothetical protein ACRC2K_09045 [Clostridium sp.]